MDAKGRLTRLRNPLLAGALLAIAGCVTIDTKAMQVPWCDRPTKGPIAQMVIIWGDGLVVQDDDDADQLPLRGQDLPGDGLVGHVPAGRRIGQVHRALVANGVAGHQRAGHERADVRVVGLDPCGDVVGGPGADGEEMLGRIVHQDDRAAGIGDEHGVDQRVDHEVEPIALGAHVGLGEAQPAMVLFQLLAGRAEIGHVVEDGDDPASDGLLAVGRVAQDGADQLEEEVGAVDGVHDHRDLGVAHAGPARFLAHHRDRRGVQHRGDGRVGDEIERVLTRAIRARASRFANQRHQRRSLGVGGRAEQREQRVGRHPAPFIRRGRRARDANRD